MGTTSRFMSLEQQVKIEFTESILRFRPYLMDAPIPGAAQAWDALTEAGLDFGESELVLRRCERLRGLELAGEEAARLAASAMVLNKRGLTALQSVRPFLAELASQQIDESVLSAWRPISVDLRAAWRDQVSQLDLEVSGAQLLVRLMDEGCDAADSDLLRGLGRYMSAHFERLEELRRSPDRGASSQLSEVSAAEPTIGPFPQWKVELAAFILGATLSIVILLLTSGAPWWNFFLVALLASLLLLLVALGC